MILKKEHPQHDEAEDLRTMYLIHSGSAGQDFPTNLLVEAEVEAEAEAEEEGDLQEQQETQMIEAMVQS